MKIAILGTGALAIAMTKILENKGHEIVMWTKFEDEKNLLTETRENRNLLAGVKIADDIEVTNDIAYAVKDAIVILNVLPFVALKDATILLKDIYMQDQIICSTTKGIDEDTFITATEIFEEELNTDKISALSGPSFAIEIARGENISFMLGGRDSKSNEIIKELLEGETIKIETTDDILGIQIAGGVKNAIAIGSGILSGLNAGDSTKASYLAMGMSDLATLLDSMGGKRETAYTYAGIGDLILTCMSPTSRNYSFGNYIGQGDDVEKAFYKMNHKTVEGYKVIKALHNYVIEKNIKLYTIPTLYSIIFENSDPKQIKKI